jgi:error-prone DNA polymerase
MRYVELHARSAFSFLRGASSPEQLAQTAAAVGLPALAVCDRDGVYGASRFFSAARQVGLRPIIGAELTMEDGSVLPVLVESRRGYQNLCRLITQAKLRAPKGRSAVRWDELAEFAEGLVALTGDEEGTLAVAARAPTGPNHVSVSPTDIYPEPGSGLSSEADDMPDSSCLPVGSAQGWDLGRTDAVQAALQRLVRIFGPGNVFVELQRHRLRGEERRVRALVDLARTHRLPLLATNGVLYAQPEGRAVLDVFTCVRHHTHLDAAGRLLSPNNERCLKSPEAMCALFADLPEAISNTVRLAERLQFSLADLGYEFPTYPVPPGHTMDSLLREQTFAGARQRYGGQVPEKVRQQLEHELAVISRLGFAGYFLVVADLVRFCRQEGIMVQGRGSAANSSVCFCLGITAVDPLKFHTLFERFLSEGRKGWPDIDLDLPSGERRERVIQEVYRRWGRRGAAMTANVITYRGRSAAREIGKALNLPADLLDRYSSLFADGDFPHTLELGKQLELAGLPRTHPRLPAFLALYRQMYGLPRHLGQHSGGMVICQGKLDTVVPLEPATMPGRTVLQWDKDDCEDLGIIKVDLLGLGMMAVLQDALELTRRRGHAVDLAQIPEDDPATYALLQRADTIGVFQVESRAQMATLPRLKPKCFYDLVIEVALIRPGPIQGRLTHPYLARRQGRAPVTYYDERLRPVLERTLGVPLFQEQILEMAMIMANFTAAEAEELRRAMSCHRSPERMARVQAKLRQALACNGVQPEVAEQIVQAVASFALYGFPESHAISFALLAYGSAYLKVHRPLEFYTALLNNQPMGFYTPATIIKDAQRHGVRIKPVCVVRSQWECTIEEDQPPTASPKDPHEKTQSHTAAVRLGLCMVRGLSRDHALQLLQERQRRPFSSLADMRARVTLSPEEWRTLAEIGALNGFAAHRRHALWEVERRVPAHDLWAEPTPPDSMAKPDAAACPLPPMTVVERLEADYAGTGVNLGPHPMALLRPYLPGVWRATDLAGARAGQTVRIAGQVICRQRPGTAKGFVFVSLEDETGISNAIVAPDLFERQRLVITQEPFLLVEGPLQKADGVLTVKARHIRPLAQMPEISSISHDFH